MKELVGARRVLDTPDPSRIVRVPAKPAAAAVAGLVPGVRIVGLTCGQFSLLDLIRAVLAQTGPADVTVSTWTAGIRDAETAAWLLSSGEIRSLRLVVDRSFPGRQPKYVRRIMKLFGNEAVLLTRTHAKFAIIKNERWNIAIRSSMNLNKNKRWEQFDLDDSADICALFCDFVDEIASVTGSGCWVKAADVEAGISLALGTEIGVLEDWERHLPSTGAHLVHDEDRINDMVDRLMDMKPAMRAEVIAEMERCESDQE